MEMKEEQDKIDYYPSVDVVRHYYKSYKKQNRKSPSYMDETESKIDVGSRVGELLLVQGEKQNKSVELVKEDIINEEE